jgi:hypothetical protein
MQHRPLRLLPSNLSPFGGIGSPDDGAPSRGPERGSWRIAHDGVGRVILALRPGGFEPSLRLEAAAARRLAGELLAFAGAIDGAASD